MEMESKSSGSEQESSQRRQGGSAAKRQRKWEPDVTVVVGGIEFQHHGLLLCSLSEFFRAALHSSMKEAIENRVELRGDHWDPNQWKEVVSKFFDVSLLAYSSTGRAEVTEDNVLQLLPWFHYLQMHNLLLICERCLRDMTFGEGSVYHRIIAGGGASTEKLELARLQTEVSVLCDSLSVCLRYDLDGLKNDICAHLVKAIAESPGGFTLDSLRTLISALARTNDRNTVTAIWNALKSYVPSEAHPVGSDEPESLVHSQLLPLLIHNSMWQHSLAKLERLLPSDDPNKLPISMPNVNDMHMYFHEKEVSTSVRPGYMGNQAQLTETMRSILVDWIIAVHWNFKHTPETLYLTISLIDRYLEKAEVSRCRFQLLGATCLLIASKYEKSDPPELRDLVYISDNAYTQQDILSMEESILKTLAYDVAVPTAHAFLVRCLMAGHADKKVVQLSLFTLDGTLLSYKLLRYLPSQLAAAAVFIARRVSGRSPWNPTLVKYSMYREEEITPVARAVLQEKKRAHQDLRGLHKKYSSSQYGGVASIELKCDF